MAEKFVFEDAIVRLEEIVKQLEQGDAPLDSSLALFEEGTKLVRKCAATLDHAEQKLKLLVKTPEGPEQTLFESQE